MAGKRITQNRTVCIVATAIASVVLLTAVVVGTVETAGASVVPSSAPPAAVVGAGG